MKYCDSVIQDIVELKEWKNIHQEQFNSSSTELEMITMDKEMAEEKADMLEKDVNCFSCILLFSF